MDKLPFRVSNDYVDIGVYFKVSSRTAYYDTGPSFTYGHIQSNGYFTASSYGGGTTDYLYSKKCFLEYKNKSKEPIQLLLDFKEIWNDGSVKQRSQISTQIAYPGDKVGCYIDDWTFLTGIHIWSPNEEILISSIPIEAVVAGREIDGSENFSVLRSLNMFISLMFYIVPGGLFFFFSGLLGSHFFNPKVIHPSRKSRFMKGHKILAIVNLVMFFNFYLYFYAYSLSSSTCVAIHFAGIIPWIIALYMIWSSRLGDGESYIEE